MPRPTPFWLTQPGRFAAIPRPRAIALATAIILTLLTLVLLPAPTPATDTGSDAFSDLSLYESVIDGIVAGGGYYQLTADALRAGDYPLRPFLTFRLPVHSVVQAMLPPAASLFLLYALAIGVAVAWWLRLAPAFARPAPRVAIVLLIGGGMIAFVQSDLIAFHEIWAAPLIALSLALRRPGRWVEAAALALIAMLVRETAAAYALAMMTLAFVEGERKEGIGWAAILGLFALVIGVHAFAVSQVTGPLDPGSPGWSGLLGPVFALDSVVTSTALRLLPHAVAIPLAALALIGWASWRDLLGRRVALTLGGYTLAIALFARADTFYWGLLMAPLWLVGLAFVPDAARDLTRSIIDRSRVRVQIISQ